VYTLCGTAYCSCVNCIDDNGDRNQSSPGSGCSDAVVYRQEHPPVSLSTFQWIGISWMTFPATRIGAAENRIHVPILEITEHETVAVLCIFQGLFNQLLNVYIRQQPCLTPRLNWYASEWRLFILTTTDWFMYNLYIVVCLSSQHPTSPELSSNLYQLTLSNAYSGLQAVHCVIIFYKLQLWHHLPSMFDSGKDQYAVNCKYKML